ncbi:MAG TPA: DUF1595 domain-containing protein [Polyangia bacterium]|nr:DUF1595 domain-containing protein [Polyangia bacterium]
METAKASAVRVRLSLVAVLGVSMVFGVASCDGTQDNATGPAATGGEGSQLQRLDALEYDRAVQRSLGVTLSNDDRLALIGHSGEPGQITPADYEQHFNRVQLLVSNVFADASLRGRILTCTPASALDASCTQNIIREFGAVAWQRPVSDAEIAQLTQVAATASSLGSDFPQSIEQVVKTMMISAPFLYRVQGV